jgi:hypothetical protein
VFKGLSFDASALFEDLLSPTEVDIRRDPVFQGLMSFFFLPLDLALGLGMIGRPSNIGHVLGIEPFGKIARDVTQPVIRQQSWSVPDMGLTTASRRQRHYR